MLLRPPTGRTLGTGSLTVPIAVSPGRSGFGPQLTLTYDSGSGNGAFGFGWSLSIPSITRKTDKGLPKYQDALETDVFILSGAEDLVPVLVDGCSQRHSTSRTLSDGSCWTIERYRPRVEGLFARIERWTNRGNGEVHWRSITRDNVTTLYGKTDNARIADPAYPKRVFSWLICESYDDKGNAIVYDYKREDSQGLDPRLAHERNRTKESRSANRYLKHIKYGNRVSRLVQPDLSQNEWMFEVVFDYGEHDPDDPKPRDTNEWLCRHDPFSSYRAGFEVRTYRLCQRVLMFHHFPNEEGVGRDCLVRSTDFIYRNIRENPEDLRRGHPVASFIASASQSGYKRKTEGGYLKKSLPPLEFEYSQVVVDEAVREIDAGSLENLPYGLDGSNYQWIDLDGEGVSGILTEQGDAWFYKPNLGEGRFGPVEQVARTPSLAALRSGRQQFLDLAGDGQLDLVDLGSATPGFFERTEDQDWAPFKPFTSLPNVRWDQPNLRFVDLDGDGLADVLITEDEVFTWYPSQAEDGFGPAQRVYKPFDEETGPRLVFADGTQSVYLADMSGDNLTDLVRIRNGEVCYWPNLGYGRFGAKVTMDNAPWFDDPDLFDQRRLRIADIDGSGNTDLIYLGGDGVRLYFNQSGNRWSEPRRLTGFPAIDNVSSVTVADLLGNGTAYLVWSSPLPGDASRPLRYIDLMGGQKPHLLISVINNLGAETRVHYAPSTRFYLADKAAGKPWITRLPFPVHVVERVETLDRISRSRFVTRYAYHHGFFDGVEREFRGFGMVEQFDTEEFAALSATGVLAETTNWDESSHVPPVLTKTWCHTGVYLGGAEVSLHLAEEYYGAPARDEPEYEAKFGAFVATLLPDTVLPPNLHPDEQREAARALRGSILRQEIYGLDGTDKERHPYSVSERDYELTLLQPRGTNRHAVFFVHPRETIDYHHERDPRDPRISHSLTLEVDAFGNVLKSAAIGYGRGAPDISLSPEDQARQTRTLVAYTENDFTNPISADDAYRTPLPSETRTNELTGYSPSGPGGRFQASDLVRAGAGGVALVFDSEINYEESPGGGRQRRRIERVRTQYRPDDLGA
jgi:hypothetical protein